MINCVLSIAGTDPSAGAGIQADLKAISATGAYAATVITVLVAQNTQGVQAIHTIPAEFVEKQLDSIFTDLEIKAVKIGMLYNAPIIKVVADYLKKYPHCPKVFDPVMVAKDGSMLLDPNAIALIKSELLPQMQLITPNLLELEHLWGKSIKNQAEMALAASEVGETFKVNVLAKGGHLEGDACNDLFYDYTKKRIDCFEAKRIATKNTHGTGCSLSAAIASYLAQGYSLLEAVKAGKDYLTKAIEHSDVLSIGKGNGPVHHFYFL